MDNDLFFKQLKESGCSFAEKGRNARSEADLSISITDKSITITIRNGIHDFFPSGRINFITFPSGRALFIYDDPKAYAFQKSHNVTCNNRYINSGNNSKLTPILKGWEGDYNLHFDDKTGWFYVLHEE